MQQRPINADKHNPIRVESTTKIASLRSVILDVFLWVRLVIAIMEAPNKPQVRKVSCAAAVHVFELIKKSSNSDELNTF